jgi:hypothetical protein
VPGQWGLRSRRKFGEGGTHEHALSFCVRSQLCFLPLCVRLTAPADVSDRIEDNDVHDKDTGERK